MQDFHTLKVWERAHEVTLLVYRVTANFPRSEAFGLTSQLRRCSSFVPSLIAEGCGRGTSADFARFLQMAMGSASECEYQLLLCRDLGYLTQAEHDELTGQVVEIKKMLSALLSAARGRRAAPSAPLKTEN
jgi:four helix bundle protein